jgi:predicted transcriptional regulator of viral defense system
VNHATGRIASRQNSLITTAQMRQTGMTVRQIAFQERQGAIDRLRRGVYRIAGAPVTWAQTVHAAVLAAGRGAAASHQTAAALWQFRHADEDSGALHITSRSWVRLSGVVSHTASLMAGDTTTRLQVPVTTAGRTLLDLTGRLSTRELGECLDDAIRRGLANLERFRQLVSTVSTRGGRRNLKQVHRLLAERLPGYLPGANDWERDMDRLWDRLRLEPGLRQYSVRDQWPHLRHRPGHPRAQDRG